MVDKDGKTAVSRGVWISLTNVGKNATRHRENRLCPFNNKVANCTKDKANNPLGVCSILNDDGGVIITCPVRAPLRLDYCRRCGIVLFSQRYEVDDADRSAS